MCANSLPTCLERSLQQQLPRAAGRGSVSSVEGGLMALARKSVVIPFVVAGLLGLAALSAWLFAIESTTSAPAACNNTYSVSAEMPRCRWPAIFVALGWI